MDLKRNTSSAMMTALSGVFHPVFFAHLDWPLVPVYAHSGVGTIAWGGHNWTGVGPLGNVEIPPETVGGVVASEAILSLVGVPADLDGMIDDPIRARGVSMSLGVVAGRPGGHDGKQTTGAGVTLVADPVEVFAGTMDGLDLDASMSEGAVNHEARVTVITGPSARSMASITHSDEDQRRRHPTDTAGRLVILAFAKAQKLIW